MQKEIQKQMTVMVAVPVAKEAKRMEGTHTLPSCMTFWIVFTLNERY